MKAHHLFVDLLFFIDDNNQQKIEKYLNQHLFEFCASEQSEIKSLVFSLHEFQKTKDVPLKEVLLLSQKDAYNPYYHALVGMLIEDAILANHIDYSIDKSFLKLLNYCKKESINLNVYSSMSARLAHILVAKSANEKANVVEGYYDQFCGNDQHAQTYDTLLTLAGANKENTIFVIRKQTKDVSNIEQILLKGNPDDCLRQIIARLF